MIKQPKKIFSDKKLTFSTLIYTVNEYVNYCATEKKDTYEATFK
jgi:hypothetical protein